MFQKKLELATLVNTEEWQKLQDSLSETLEITLRTALADGTPFSQPSRPNRLCTEILPKISSALSPCLSCALELKGRFNIKTDTNFKCPFDLDVFVIPIKAIGNEIVACIITGPVICKSRKEKSDYEKEARQAGVDLDALMDALIDINVFSYTKIYAINQLLRQTFSHMAQTGYHKKRLGEIAPEVIELDPIFSRYYEEKVLSALLNSCTVALDADSGSIMTLDSRTNMLHIKVASKLDEGVVNNTNIKLGEAIAGVAAATAQPIMLPKDEGKNGLSKKMKRQYIKSSMIVPFSKGNTREVYGVINLNLTRKNQDFSDRDIVLVKELINMASIALIPIKESNPEVKDIE